MKKTKKWSKAELEERAIAGGTKNNLVLRKRNGKKKWVKIDNIKVGDSILGSKGFEKVLKICPMEMKTEKE